MKISKFLLVSTSLAATSVAVVSCSPISDITNRSIEILKNKIIFELNIEINNFFKNKKNDLDSDTNKLNENISDFLADLKTKKITSKFGIDAFSTYARDGFIKIITDFYKVKQTKASKAVSLFKSFDDLVGLITTLRLKEDDVEKYKEIATNLNDYIEKNLRDKNLDLNNLSINDFDKKINSFKNFINKEIKEKHKEVLKDKISDLDKIIKKLEDAIKQGKDLNISSIIKKPSRYKKTN